MKRIIAMLSTALLLTFGAINAKAEVISEWSYELSGIFTSWTNNQGVSWQYGDGPNQTGINGANERTLPYDYFKGQPDSGSQTGVTALTWGGVNPNIASFTSNSGTVTTDGPYERGVEIGRVNWTLPTDAVIPFSGTALLTMALGPAGQAIEPMIFATEMDFYYMKSPGKWDIFVVEDPIMLGTETFSYLGEFYQFSFAASFIELYGEYANYVRELLGWDADKAVYGWVTNENQLTSFTSTFSIKKVPVPEPATMMLVGIGLAGLGALARRRRRA